MIDRIPTQILSNGAIRNAIYDENGTFLRYEWIKKDDEPTQAGTPINKANLLSDNTSEAIFADQNDHTVNEAFLAPLISNNFANYITIILNIKTSGGVPVPAVPVTCSNLTDKVYTDTRGQVKMLVPVGTGSITLTPVLPFDINSFSPSSITISNPTEKLYIYNIMATLPANPRTKVTYTGSNSNICVSGLQDFETVKVWACGGGGSGAAWINSAGLSYVTRAGGGAGGYTSLVTIPREDFLNRTFTSVIGAGGASVTSRMSGSGAGPQSGNQGGTTTLTDNSSNTVIVTANGGGGGSDDGRGGNGGSGGGSGTVSSSSSAIVQAGDGGSDGGNGGYSGTYNSSDYGKGQGTTTRAFEEQDGTLYCGGGGASAIKGDVSYYGVGGNGGGGNGSTSSGQSGSIYGAGGGGAARLVASTSTSSSISSGAGYQGAIMIKLV